MNQNYRQLLPKWFEEQKNFELVLSDDLDSLLSCAILKKINNWKIRYFYDFEHLYISEKSTKDTEQRVWVDVAVLNGEKAFDNHVSMVSLEDKKNRNMINPNVMCYITNDNYTDKYAGSTALLIWSLYGLPLPETDEGKMILLAIDSAFKGHYSSMFEERNTFFIKEVLGYGELVDLMSRRTICDFNEVIDKYGLNKKIKYIDGKIQTDLDIKTIGKLLGINLDVIVDDTFELQEEYCICEQDIINERTVSDISRYAFTLAFTFKNSVRYSTVKIEKKEEKDIEWINRIKSAKKKKLIF
jgi:hypothetical protein